MRESTERRSALKSIAFITNKGGVGKTTTTANIGRALTLLGKRVMLVNFDMNTDLEEGFHLAADNAPIEHTDIDRGLHTIFDGDGFLNAYYEIQEVEGLYIVPTHRSDFEEAVHQKNALDVFQNALNDFIHLEHELDFILFDSSPRFDASAKLLVSLVDFIVIVTESNATFATDGLIRFWKRILEFQRKRKIQIQCLGTIINKYDPLRSIKNKESIGEIRELHKGLPFDLIEPPIMFQGHINDSQKARVSIFDYEHPRPTPAFKKIQANYQEVAEKIIQRIEERDNG